MVCPNCGSNDIVAIQGQNYCINCGQLVGAVSEPVAKVEPKPITAAVAADLDPAVVTPPKVEKPAPVPPVAKTKKAAKLVKKVAPVAVPAAVAVAAEAPKEAPRRISDLGVPEDPAVKLRPRSRHMLDLSPKAAAQQKQPAPKPTASAPKPAGVGHTATLSAKLSLGFGVVTGAVVGAYFWFALDAGVLAYALIGLAVALALTLVVTQSALQIGWSRQLDGRPTPSKLWWAVAWQAFWPSVTMNLISALKLGFLALLAVLAVIGVDRYLPADPNWVQPTVLGVVNLVLVLFALGVLAARRIALTAITLGGYSPVAAYKLGWGLYFRAGGHLTATLIESALAQATVALIGCLIAIGLYHYQPQVVAYVPVAVQIGLAVAIMVSLILWVWTRVIGKLWLRCYRHWAPLVYPAQRIQLLTGYAHPTARPKKASKTAVDR